MNALTELHEVGQSVWLDYIDRRVIDSGKLQRLIDEDGLRGVTSNPAIFEKAISSDPAYTEDLRLNGNADTDPALIFEQLAIPDIRVAADLLRPVYLATGYRDGYVSLEVSPALAYSTAGTVVQAQRLWREVDRENLMIKVPVTEQGLPAITQLIAEGINVNATLLFSGTMYERLTEAWLAGLEQRAATGGNLGRVSSVASFFVSRIDTVVDDLIGARMQTCADAAMQSFLKDMLGKVAIANAKLAYQHYRKLVADERWKTLAAKGAQPQRLLWASTGVKNPAYRDVMYIEELIGPDTVNTVPPATLDAFRNHGRVRATLETGAAEAEAILYALSALDISLDDITATLLKDGVNLFADAYTKLLGAIALQIGNRAGVQ